jgi:hypothetical protein
MHFGNRSSRRSPHDAACSMDEAGVTPEQQPGLNDPATRSILFLAD